MTSCFCSSSASSGSVPSPVRSGAPRPFEGWLVEIDLLARPLQQLLEPLADRQQLLVEVRLAVLDEAGVSAGDALLVRAAGNRSK